MDQSFTVLIVDDQPKNLQVLALTLDELGVRTIAANSGISALKIVELNKPDLVLLDIMMPEMDGFEVIEILKQNIATKNIPVIFLSAKSETEDIIKGFKKGAVDYITKPFKREELIARVETQLNLKKSYDIIRKQAVELEEAYLKLRKSINYAGMIQSITIPSEATLRSLLPDSFLLFKPKDIVSGDFFWIAEENTKIYLAVADATGHGVPGAMISMLGISFLNELIGKLSEYDSDSVMDYLRKKMKTTLRQKDSLVNISDGMAISFCIIDRKNKKMKFSGAEQSIIVSRRVETETEVFEIKGDSMPIAVYFDETSFTEHDIEIRENDCIYLLTDGYFDQLGGDNDRRFMKKNFIKIIEEISLKPLIEQKNIIENKIYSWMGFNNTQIDDILIIGFRI
jgi:CheY-like chemotaxis protein